MNAPDPSRPPHLTRPRDFDAPAGVDDSGRSQGSGISGREWAVGIVVVLALAYVAMPVFPSGCGIPGPQVRALAQAKGIGLALKLYAGDHDGVYPAGVDAFGGKIVNSNDAYRMLFPMYTQSETIFGNKVSAWQTRVPDNVISTEALATASAEKMFSAGDKFGTRKETLRPGENVYGYIAGLTDADNPSLPLVMDGTDGTGRGTYVSDPKARGGVWSGNRAVVIHLDNSGTLENLTGPPNARFVTATGQPAGANALSPDILGPKLRLLDPAVAR